MRVKCIPHEIILGLLEDPCKRWGPWCGRWGGHPPRGGMGTKQATAMAPRPPLYREECWLPAQHTCSQIEVGYSQKINTFSGDAMPGKMDVSFIQWYHEVQCIKDHYPDSVVWESIVRSLKGAVADMAWCMGPTASVAHILQKLAVIFGSVASFNILMENFYKVT